MTWRLPALAATVTSLSRAGTGAFMVQLPCACAVDAAVNAHVPTAAQTHASVIVLRARSLIVPLPFVPYSRRVAFDATRRKPLCRKTLVRSAVGRRSARPSAPFPKFVIHLSKL